MKTLTPEQLHALSTRRLLTYYRKLRKVTDVSSVCECGCGALVEEIFGEDSDQYRECKKNKANLTRVKKILDNRENVK